jgi:hypothetical protein
MATYASIKYDMTLSSSATGAGALTLLSTQTASSSAAISFTSGIDSTYKEYVFKFFNIHPATGTQDFQVGFRDGSTNYDATKTTTFFVAAHSEDNSSEAQLEYRTAQDLAQSTGFQPLCWQLGNGNDDSADGTLHLFDPSSTTFVKHFVATTNWSSDGGGSVPTSKNSYVAGYCNVTAAIDGVQFKMSSGNIDAGTIKLYGVS